MTTPDDYARCVANTRNVQTLVGLMAARGMDVAVGAAVTTNGTPFAVIVAQGWSHEMVEDIGRRIAEAVIAERAAAKLRAERG